MRFVHSCVSGRWGSESFVSVADCCRSSSPAVRGDTRQSCSGSLLVGSTLTAARSISEEHLSEEWMSVLKEVDKQEEEQISEELTKSLKEGGTLREQEEHFSYLMFPEVQDFL